MKVIDLLNKIANGKEIPKEICFRNEIFTYDELRDNYYTKYGFIISDYITELSEFNEKVEIIEEEKKIPEKIEYNDGNLIKNHIALANFDNDFYLADKINEIIDYLKSKESDK